MNRERSLEDLDRSPLTSLPPGGKPEVVERLRQRPVVGLLCAPEQRDGPLEKDLGLGVAPGQDLLEAVVQQQAREFAFVAERLGALEQVLEERLGFGMARLAGERDGQPLLRLGRPRIVGPEQRKPRLEGAAPVRLALIGQGDLVEDPSKERVHLGPQLGLCASSRSRFLLPRSRRSRTVGAEPAERPGSICSKRLVRKVWAAAARLASRRAAAA